jgi:hypothetical protein
VVTHPQTGAAAVFRDIQPPPAAAVAEWVCSTGRSLTMHKQRIAILLIAAAGMAGTFLPWLTFGGLFEGVSIHGIFGDGLISLALFAVAAVIALVGDRRKSWQGGGFIAFTIPALLASALGIYHIVDLYVKRSSPSASGEIDLFALANPGVGLYLVAAAGIALVATAFALQGRPASRRRETILQRAASAEHLLEAVESA